jgi:hypothetical protein
VNGDSPSARAWLPVSEDRRRFVDAHGWADRSEVISGGDSSQLIERRERRPGRHDGMGSAASSRLKAAEYALSFN